MTPPKLPAALADAWAQRPGEADEEYFAFLSWLDEGAERKTPGPLHQKTATRWQWSERCLAFERVQALRARPHETQEEAIEQNLLHLVLLETGKLLHSSATTVGPIASVGEVIKVLGYLAELKGQSPRARGNAPIDTSKLSTEDLKKVLAAQDIMRRAMGG